MRGLAFPSHVILRPVFFMENLLGPAFATGIKQGKLVAALDPKTRLQMVAARRRRPPRGERSGWGS